MQLIDELRRRAEQEASPFMAQLIREDIGRLEAILASCRALPGREALQAEARKLRWTAQDARTAELSMPLERLVDAIWRRAEPTGTAEDDADMLNAWQDLTRLRVERMIGCLSTRLPPEFE